MIGHCLSAAGSIVLLQYCNCTKDLFFHINCEDLNPEITSIIDVSRIPQKLIETELKLSLKPVLVWRC
jgi:hypothetical protein